MNKSIQAAKIKIGISSCLLGNRVRYDGGHKRDSFLVQTLGAFVEYVPVCPEVEAGFSIPREAFRLVGDPSAPRMVTQKSGVDVTERMLAWAWKRAKQLNEEELCGFIFKSDSPSSGMERVKVYDENGFPAKRGIGLFARVFMEYFPSMPVEEEGRLNDFHLRENFVERVFTYWRWKKVLFKGKTPTRLIEFHSRHKLLLMAHHPQMQREMGKWVAQSKKISIDSLFSGYFDMLMNAMKKKATTRKHVNVLMHMMGYFKAQLTGAEKKELLEVIADFHNDDVPLLVPLTLLKHYVHKSEQPNLLDQYYLDPHPLELRIRNHS